MDQMTIGEAAQRSGLPPKTIRYYEEIGLLAAAPRAGNNYRAYDDADVELLRFIGRARGLGFSLHEIQDLIALHRDRGRSSREVKDVALRRIGDIERKIAELNTMRNSLQELADRCRGDEYPECAILDELAPLCGARPPAEIDVAHPVIRERRSTRRMKRKGTGTPGRSSV